MILSGTFWSTDFLLLNLHLLLHLLGAFGLGICMGYERAFRGRAAGMRTYGFVCMASAALTIVMGFPQFWFGGHAVLGFADPSRVIQGIVTGLGFLGAGVIMRDTHNNITGLSTAASLWVASAVGVFVGLGFYLAAIGLALVTTLSLAGVGKLQGSLPSTLTLTVRILIRQGASMNESALKSTLLSSGFAMQDSSISLNWDERGAEWSFTVSTDKLSSKSYASRLHQAVLKMPEVGELHFHPTRN